MGWSAAGWWMLRYSARYCSSFECWLLLPVSNAQRLITRRLEAPTAILCLHLALDNLQASQNRTLCFACSAKKQC
jgi:hypothetical protein